MLVVKHNTEYPIKLDIIVLRRGVSAIAAKTCDFRYDLFGDRHWLHEVFGDRLRNRFNRMLLQNTKCDHFVLV